MKPRNKREAILAIRNTLVGELVAIRSSTGLTQAEVARRMAVHQPRVAEFERRGERSAYFDTALAYAAAVGARLEVRRLEEAEEVANG